MTRLYHKMQKKAIAKSGRCFVSDWYLTFFLILLPLTIVKNFIFILNLIFLTFGTARAEDDFGIKIWDEYKTISKGEIFPYDMPIAQNSMWLDNYGEIYGDISINAGKMLAFKNAGAHFGTVRINAGGQLIQVINGTGDFNTLNISRVANSSFIMLADGVQDVDFMNLAAFASAADKLIIKDSTLNFNPGDHADVPIEIAGTVVFKLGEMPNRGQIAFMSDVDYTGALFVAANVSKMFYVETKYNENEIVLMLQRETDYEKVIGGNKGRFLNAVRASGINPLIMAALDAAQTESELGKIMAHSVMFSPIKLMSPVKLMSKFTGVNLIGADVIPAKAGIPPLQGIGSATTIFGNDLLLYTGNAGVEFATDDFVFGAYGHFGEFSQTGFEDFAGIIYGGTVRAAMYKRLMHAEIAGGVTFVNFDSGPIYNGAALPVYNPSGLAYYGSAEIGVRAFDFGDVRCGEFFVMPIARVRAFSASVLNDSESEISFGGGARIGYGNTMMGIRTEYSAYGLIENGGGQFGIRTDIGIPRDGVALFIDVAMMEMEIGRFYKIGAGAKINF